MEYLLLGNKSTCVLYMHYRNMSHYYHVTYICTIETCHTIIMWLTYHHLCCSLWGGWWSWYQFLSFIWMFQWFFKFWKKPFLFFSFLRTSGYSLCIKGCGTTGCDQWRINECDDWWQWSDCFYIRVFLFIKNKK